MTRYFFKLLHLTVFAVSITIVIYIFRGHIFLRDQSYADIDLKWPNKVKLGVLNFGCSIPTPNFNVTEYQLNRAWGLSLNSRLSPIMRDIAHCELAANFSKGVFDSNKCWCINVWPIFVLIAALFNAVFKMYRLTIGFSIDGKKSKGTVEYVCLYLICIVPLCLMAFIAFYYHDVSNLGLSYWAYGDFYPRSYYQKPQEWNFMASLAMVGFYVVFFEAFLCFALMIQKFCSGLDFFKKMKAWIIMKRENSGPAPNPTPNEGNLPSIGAILQAKGITESREKECKGHV